MNEESILLGAWLRGEHLEDIKQLNMDEFSEQYVVKQLLEGKKGMDIAIETSRVTEFAQLMQVHSDVLYKQAFSSALTRQIHHEIANMTDLKLIRDKINYLDGVTESTAEEFKDPAVALAEELSLKANRKTVRWDKLPSLNNMTDGIKRKELTAIAARPAVGKSAFGLQIAMGVQARGEKVLYFPLEMSATQTYGRVIISKGYLTSREVRTGKPDKDENLLFALEYVDKIYRNRNFQIYEGENQLERIEAVIKKEKPYLVVIDQLTQLRANKHFKSVREQFSHMTSNLKAIAMRENVAIMLLCQINRSADNIPPTMANLKESGSIEEDSDNIILLHNLTPDQVSNPAGIDWKNERPMLCNLAKQRDGVTGEFTMMFMPSMFTFYERA